MRKDKEAKIAEKYEVQGSFAYDALEKFLGRHLAEGHELRMFLDTNGNCYAIFCAACDPRMGDAMETRH